MIRVASGFIRPQWTRVFVPFLFWFGPGASLFALSRLTYNLSGNGDESQLVRNEIHSNISCSLPTSCRVVNCWNVSLPCRCLRYARRIFSSVNGNSFALTPEKIRRPTA